MGFEAERVAIETRLQTQWATTAIAYENVPYNPTEGTSYVELSIIDGPSEQISLGDGLAALHRSYGTISIGVFVPLHTGTVTAKTYADSIALIFRNWVDTTSGVHCRSPSIYKIGEDSGWWRMNILIPFYVDVSFP